MVDVDLEKFFDRVNHDVLMGRLAKRIEDGRVWVLIRRYLNAGVMADGVVVDRYEGTPQGGPLSPLLANVLLDEVDKELERRVRQITRRTRGRSLVEVVQDLRAYLLGWHGYFRIANTPGRMRELDKWIRHRLRAYQLKHWKRGKTVFRELVARGMGRDAAARVAANARRWWHNSAMSIHIALPNSLFEGMGLPSLVP